MALLLITYLITKHQLALVQVAIPANFCGKFVMHYFLLCHSIISAGEGLVITKIYYNTKKIIFVK